jgi:glycosyltransferase involved in cell wall biosynthesis
MLKLSIVIPTFNRAHLIRRSIESVLSQMEVGDELIVVDDGSTDDTESVVASIAGDRVRYVRQQNAGAGSARNRGVREATGDLIAFQDSDDEWLPGKAAFQRQFLAARPDVLFCFTDLGRDYAGTRHPLLRGGLWHKDMREWDEILSPRINYDGCNVYIGDLYHGAMYHNYFSIICTMIRRKEAGDSIRFAENVATFEECECFGRLAARGNAAFIDFVGALQHKHPGPRITDADWVARADSRLAILDKVWGSDAQFLAQHGNEYRALVNQVRLAKVRGLIVLGRPREAREEIRALSSVPFLYRAAARVPANLINPAVALRHAMHGLLTRADSAQVPQ